MYDHIVWWEITESAAPMSIVRPSGVSVFNTQPDADKEAERLVQSMPKCHVVVFKFDSFSGHWIVFRDLHRSDGGGKGEA